MNPNHDSLESVATYVAKFAQDFLGAAGLSVRWELPIDLPDWPVSSDVRHTLFLAYKEALNNIVRHARATRVTILLRPDESHFVLRVDDDGCGFDPLESTPRAGGGNGLANMRARLQELGGRVEIVTQPGNGTTVTFTIPFRLAPLAS